MGFRQAIVAVAIVASFASGFATDVSGAVIRGRAVDSENAINLEGVRIEVEGTGISVYSERGGEFVIRNVPTGRYELTATYVGYPSATQAINLETASASNFVVIDLHDEETVDLEEFVVEGTMIGKAKAINLQRSADNLKNVVSSDAFGQFVDRNAAEALQRLPGVSLEESQGEGKYIIIRGADPSFNAVTIDGVTVATPEEDGRSTALNIISTDQLERIELEKTWLPDKSGNTVGGTVNLVSRSALDRGERFGSVEGAFTQHKISNDDSYRFNATFGDILGKKKNIGLQISYNKSVDNRGSDTLRADEAWHTTQDLPLLAFPAGFWMGGLEMEDFIIKRERSGIGGKIEFQLGDHSTFHASGSFNQFDDDEVLQETRFDVRAGGTFYTRQSRLTLAIASALGYDLDDPEVQARLALPSNSRRLRFDEAEAIGDIAWDPVTHNFTIFGGNSTPWKTWQNTVTADEILTYQLGGKHRLGEWLEFDYRYFASEAKKNWTERRVTLQTDSIAMGVVLGEDYFPQVRQDADLDEADLTFDPERYKINRNRGRAADNVFSSTDTRNGFEVNLQAAYKIGDFSATTKFGAHFDFREKEFLRDFNRFSTVEVDPLPQIALSDPVFFGGPLETGFLSHRTEYDFGPSFDTAATNAFFDDPGDVEFVEEGDDVTFNVTDAILKNYLATEDVLAGYFMQTLEKGSLKIIAGVRFEETRNTFTNTEILTRPEGLPIAFVLPAFWQRLPLDAFSEQKTSEKSYTHVLPAIHVRKDFGEKSVLRASYTETIARPKFTNLVPREIVTIDGSEFGRTVDLPNFDLAPMESNNVDLSFERYFTGLGLFSVSGFYKKLTGPVYLERRTVDVGTELSAELAAKYDSLGRDDDPWTTNQWQNAGDGEIRGVELALERKLNFLPQPFDGFSVSFNTAFIDSSVQLLLEERFGEELPMFKQSSSLGNLSVSYEKFGLLVRLAMVWRGEYLDPEGVRGGKRNIADITDRHELPTDSLDVYVDDFMKLDLTVRYRFREHFNFFFEATNLTDEPLRRYEGHTTRLHSIQFTDTIFSFGAKWNL